MKSFQFATVSAFLLYVTESSYKQDSRLNDPQIVLRVGGKLI